jgi:hypothetical protein
MTDADAEAAAAADVAFQRAARAAGVPLPLPVPRADGRVLLAHGAGGRFRVYEWVDLAPDAAGSGAQIGAIAAVLHRLEHPAGGEVEPWFAEPMGGDGWAEVLAAAERARAWWSGPLRRALAEFVAVEAAVRAPDPAAVRTCHRDLNVDNVRLRVGGEPVVLDWENCGPLEPVRELATIVAQLREDVSPDAARAAYVAYRERGGPHRLTAPADFSTAIVLQGHLLRYYGGRSLAAPTATGSGSLRGVRRAEPGWSATASGSLRGVRRAEPERSDEDRRRADQRLRTALARPLTRRAIDELLAAFAPYA